MQMSVDWHPLFLLPALDGGHVTAQIGRDFRPRFEALLGVSAVGISNDGSAIALSRGPIQSSRMERTDFTLPPQHGKIRCHDLPLAQLH